jgi:hypothetical protein
MSIQSSNKETREKYQKSFDDLPEDMLNIILEYLPIKKRLEILKLKYSKKYIKTKLQTLSDTTRALDKLWLISENYKYLLRKIYEPNSPILYTIPLHASTFRYKSKKYKNQHTSSEYKEMFIQLISTITDNYTKFYSKNENIKKTNKFEKQVFKLFANVALIK